MDNQSSQKFYLAFDVYIGFLHKQTPANLNSNVFGGFKSNYRNELQALNNITQNSSTSFIDSFIKFVDFYAEIKLQEPYFYQDVLFFRLLDVLKSYSTATDLPNTSICNFSREQSETFKTLIDSFNSAISNSTNNFNSQSSQNSRPRRKGIEDIDPALFVNFEDSKSFISSLYNKLFRYENHIKIFKTHLDHNTTPSALFYNKFPEPFLNDDQEYVSKYNKLIDNFQHEVLNLSKSFLEKRISTLDSKLSAIKSNLTEKNADLDINKYFSEIISHQNSNLREHFDKANSKASRAKSIPFVAGKKFNSSNSNNNSRTSEMNRSTSSTASTTSIGSSILRNRNNDHSYNSSSSSSRRVAFSNSHDRPHHSSSYSNDRNNGSRNNFSRNNNYNRSNYYNNNSNTSSSNFNPYSAQN